ncbi:MAG: cytochrome b/b6 domain-containing protein [Sphingopyxis sp.]
MIEVNNDSATGEVERVPVPAGGELVRRHALATRIWHWVNAVTLLIMLGSGLTIFNAHPRLYWGEYGANADYAWLQIGAENGHGYIRVGDARLVTTGLLGLWVDDAGVPQNRAFPSWATIPSDYNLADGRLWHFFFAWVLGIALVVYMAVSLINRHFWRDLRIRPAELAPSHIWHDIKQHIRLRFPTGAAALRYNILQKLSYVGVIFALLPLIIMTGLAMSPTMDAAWPWLLDLFGGRASARSLHFIAAFLLFAFFVVHMVMVLLAEPINEVRSMVTGWYRLPRDRVVPEPSGEGQSA